MLYSILELVGPHFAMAGNKEIPEKRFWKQDSLYWATCGEYSRTKSKYDESM